MNFLLLIADSLRAENTSMHGYKRDTTPFLEKLAEDSIEYYNAIAPSIWSLPSHTSIFTGLHAQEHQLYTTNSALGECETIWDIFQNHGHRTGVFSRNIFITRPQYGLTDGFHHIDSDYSHTYPFRGMEPDGSYTKLEYILSSLKSEHTMGSLLNGVSFYLDSRGYAPAELAPKDRGQSHNHVDRFLNWSSSVDGEWAACINFMKTHHDYTPSQKYNRWATEETMDIQNELDDQGWSFYSGQRPWSDREALVDLYDGAIRQVDQAVKYLYGSLLDRGDIEETIIVFTSDHGEGFGEYSEIRDDVRLAGHRCGIDDVLIHVPLLIFSPEHGHDVIKKPVSLTGIGKALKKGPHNFNPADVEETAPVSAVDITDRLSYDVHGNELELDYDVDLDRLKGMAQAGYKMADGEVLKYANWGDSSLQSPIEEEIKSIWENFSNQEVAENASVSEETEDRLKDLGYV